MSESSSFFYITPYKCCTSQPQIVLHNIVIVTFVKRRICECVSRTIEYTVHWTRSRCQTPGFVGMGRVYAYKAGRRKHWKPCEEGSAYVAYWSSRLESFRTGSLLWLLISSWKNNISRHLIDLSMLMNQHSNCSFHLRITISLQACVKILAIF